MRFSESEKLFAAAQRVLPGGVNSPVRAFKGVGGTPVTFRRGEGAWLEDWDGNRYLDFCCSWGPLVLGHAHPYVRERINAVLDDGWTFGAPHRSETRLAEMVLAQLEFAEKVRFVNSGTEAVMSAVRLARGATGRALIVKFDGCYHGHLDSLLVKAGSGLATFGNPTSAGVPEETAAGTLVLPLDEEAALETAFAQHGDRIAALIIESIPANNGLLVQRPEFINACRELTSRHGALLILDEVLVGFRVPPMMAFQSYGVAPDLVTIGKVIGGGMPAAGFAGSTELMEQLAPNGPVYQAGTLSGNPVAMTAGIATLEMLTEKGAWDRLMTVAERFEECIRAELSGVDAPVSYVQRGSIFWFAFDSDSAPRTAAGISASGIERYKRFHRRLLEKNVYFAPSGYEVGFLNAALTDEEIDRAAGTIIETIAEIYTKEYINR